MRLFIAVDPPPGALAELGWAVAPLQAQAPDLRWTGADGWHLTLAFLGDVADHVLPDLTVRLQRAAGPHPAQELAIAGGGAFPSPVRARVLWAGVRGDDAALARLAASVAAGARRAGAPPPDGRRRFRAHLTLARCQEPSDVSALSATLAAFCGTPWSASRIHLIRSHLGSGPPRYEDLGSWPLADAQAH